MTMRRKNRMQRLRDRGVAAVEFALVLPLLLLLILGSIDWGFFFYVDQVVTNAAREGARKGVVQAKYADASSVAVDAARAYLDQVRLGSSRATVTFEDGGLADGVGAKVEYKVGSITGFLKGIMPANATATAVMRWEGAP